MVIAHVSANSTTPRCGLSVVKGYGATYKKDVAPVIQLELCQRLCQDYFSLFYVCKIHANTRI